MLLVAYTHACLVAAAVVAVSLLNLPSLRQGTVQAI